MLHFLDSTGTPTVSGQEVRPAEFLKSRGLDRQRGATAIWVLTGEAPVLKSHRAAKGLATQLSIAERQERAIDTPDQDPKPLIDAYRAQISQYDEQVAAIDHQLALLGPPAGIRPADLAHNLLVQEQNAIIREQRRLGTLIRNLYDQRDGVRAQKWQIRQEAARLREAYQLRIDNLQESVPKLQRKYAELGEDKAIEKALADLTASSGIKQKLGPTKDFQAAVNWLERNGDSERRNGTGDRRTGSSARRQSRRPRS
jgi:hypothetical protein